MIQFPVEQSRWIIRIVPDRTLLDECFRVASRTAWHLEPHEIQADLDRFLAWYNAERSHQGYTLPPHPTHALREPAGIEDLPPFIPAPNEVQPTQAT